MFSEHVFWNRIDASFPWFAYRTDRRPSVMCVIFEKKLALKIKPEEHAALLGHINPI